MPTRAKIRAREPGSHIGYRFKEWRCPDTTRDLFEVKGTLSKLCQFDEFAKYSNLP